MNRRPVWKPIIEWLMVVAVAAFFITVTVLLLAGAAELVRVMFR